MEGLHRFRVHVIQVGAGDCHSIALGKFIITFIHNKLLLLNIVLVNTDVY